MLNSLIAILLLFLSTVSDLYWAYPLERLSAVPSKRVFYSTGYGPGGMNVLLQLAEGDSISNGAFEPVKDDTLLEIPKKQSVSMINDYSKSLKMLKNLKVEIQHIQTKIKNGELKPSPYLVDLLNVKAKELLTIAQHIKANRQTG